MPELPGQQPLPLHPRGRRDPRPLRGRDPPEDEAGEVRVGADKGERRRVTRASRLSVWGSRLVKGPGAWLAESRTVSRWGSGRPETPLDLVPPSLHACSAGTCLSPGLTAGGRWGRPPALPLSRGPSTTYNHATPPARAPFRARTCTMWPLMSVLLWVRRGVPGAGIRAGFGGRRGDPEWQVPGSTAGGWGPSSSEQWCPPRTRQPGLRGPECAAGTPRPSPSSGEAGSRRTRGGGGQSRAGRLGAVCCPGEVSKVLRWREGREGSGQGGGPEDRDATPRSPAWTAPSAPWLGASPCPHGGPRFEAP